MHKNVLVLAAIIVLLFITALTPPAFAQAHGFTTRAITVQSLMPIARPSPNGTLIAVFHQPAVHDSTPLDRYLWLIDARTGDEVSTLDEATTTISNAAFSADGSRLVAVQTNGDVYVWDTLSQRLLDVLTMPFYGGVHSLRFVQDTAKVVFVHGSRPSQIVFLDTDTGSITRILAPTFDTFAAFDETMSDFMRSGDHVFTSADLTPDAGMVAVATANDGVFLWDVETRERTGIGSQAAAVMGFGISELAFSADGTRLVYAMPRDGRVVLYDIVDGTEGAVPITAHAFVLAPDGDHLVWAQHEPAVVFVAPLDAPEAAEALLELPGNVQLAPRLSALHFSADGNLVVLSGLLGDDGDNALYLFERAR